MFENSYGVVEIKMFGVVHHYCPLGSDWCTTDIEVTVGNPEQIPDYCDVTEFFKTLDGKTLLIEDICNETIQFIVNQTRGKVSVVAKNTDAEHLPVVVTSAGGGDR